MLKLISRKQKNSYLELKFKISDVYSHTYRVVYVGMDESQYVTAENTLVLKIPNAWGTKARPFTVLIEENDTVLFCVRTLLAVQHDQKAAVLKEDLPIDGDAIALAAMAMFPFMLKEENGYASSGQS